MDGLILLPLCQQKKWPHIPCQRRRGFSLPIDPINRRNQRHEESGTNGEVQTTQSVNSHLSVNSKPKGGGGKNGDRSSQSLKAVGGSASPGWILEPNGDAKSNTPAKKNSGAAGPARSTGMNQIQPTRDHGRPTRSRTNSPDPTKVGDLEGKRLVCTTGNALPHKGGGWFRAVVLLQSPGKSPDIRFHKKKRSSMWQTNGALTVIQWTSTTNFHESKQVQLE